MSDLSRDFTPGSVFRRQAVHFSLPQVATCLRLHRFSYNGLISFSSSLGVSAIGEHLVEGTGFLHASRLVKIMQSVGREIVSELLLTGRVEYFEVSDGFLLLQKGPVGIERFWPGLLENNSAAVLPV